MKRGPKHKICRRVGACLWGNPKCPSVKRPYPPGSSPRARRGKMTTYGELLQEKQKLQAHYAVTEGQLRFTFRKAQHGKGVTGDKLVRSLEQRLASFVYRSGLAPTIFSAKQIVSHRHVYVNGRVTDRPGYLLKPGDTVSIDLQKSPSIASIAQKSDINPPPYIEVDQQNAKATLSRPPVADEIPVDAEVTRVVEYYAR